MCAATAARAFCVPQRDPVRELPPLTHNPLPKHHNTPAKPNQNQTKPKQNKHKTGLNNNSYQISRGLYHNNRAGHGITETCGFVKADFMRMPFEDASFDAVYEIDATCHAPDQVRFACVVCV